MASLLRFCKTCKNLLETGSVDGKLVHTCKFCNESVPIQQDALVYEHVVKSNLSYDSLLNPYSIYDITLPHFTNIPCPNKECKSKKAKGPMNEVVGINADRAKMKFVYQCVHCSASWTN